MSDEWKPMNFSTFFPGRKMEEFIFEGYPDTQLLHAEVNMYGQESHRSAKELEEQYESLFEEIDLYAEALTEQAIEAMEGDGDFGIELEFADPGGISALRAATPSNPRIFPCPTCGEPNRLTQKDVDRGYQCDACADRAEAGY